MKEYWVEINIADWVEANSKEEAIEKVKANKNNWEIICEETEED